MDQTPERITYSVKEAAAALGVSEWMVREEIRIGRTRFRQVRRSYINPPPGSGTTRRQLGTDRRQSQRRA